MQFVKGIALPAGDTHFQKHLEAGPEFEGKGTYQFNKIEIALGLASDRRGLAVDVGGHVGLWSRILCKHFQKVVAFEPVPQLAKCFRVNAPDAVLVERALSDYSGEALVDVPADNSGNAHILTGLRTTTSMVVHIDLLDQALPQFSTMPVDLLKIDVEGYEVSVMRGARVTIMRDKPAIVVECKPGNAERYGYGETQAVKLLTSWGYGVRRLKSGDFFLTHEG